MKLSKAVILELKSVIKYYKYLHLKENEVIIKVFTVRWDTETCEVYLNQKNEKLASYETLNKFLIGLVSSVELKNCPYLLVAVAINRKGNIVIKDNGELALFHTQPKNIHSELVQKPNVSVTGGRAEQNESVPYSTKQ
jgi:hypothetical protein